MRPGPLDLNRVAGQLRQEAGRALLGLLSASGRHHQQLLGPGHRYVEQAALLGQEPGGERGDRDVG